MNELDVREQSSLDTAFEQADNLLMKKYISNISNYQVVPISTELQNKNVSSFSRFFKIESIVYDKEENNLDKLSSVYNAIAGCGGSIVMVIKSDGNSVSFYLGTKSDESSVSACQSVLAKALKGNFPGSNLTLLRNNELELVVNNVFKTEYENSTKSISAISGISSFRTSLYDSEKTGFVQGIEKLIDAMRGEKYTVMLIADPVSQVQIEQIRSGYENLYSQLVPFASTELNFSANESDAITDSITTGLSKSISENLSKTQSYSQGSAKNYSNTKSSSKNGGLSLIVVNAGSTTNKSRTEGGSETWNNTDSEAKTSGVVDTKSDQKSTSSTTTEGRSRSLQIKFENKSVKNLLGKVDEQLDRLNECSDLGMWNCSAYVIADDIQTSKVVASTYQSLMRGENSSIENAAVNTWSDKDKLSVVTSYLKKMHHPLIDINENNKNELPYVTPTSLLSGNELTIQAGFPQKSIPGLAVIEYAAFGREILSQQSDSDRNISLGKIYHMGKEETLDVNLDLQSLASHTFITGSTGSGKSNLVYKLLTEINERNVTFLVIEPAKGEYKHVFGNRSDVHVFGTNPAVSPLLKINPFKFPIGIHVLEHIDRLIEIFNVCWPMYAAMPAVLKEAIEASYMSSGWDLETSLNKHNDQLFPTFEDVLFDLNRVISNSAYSDEVKSNYKGALFTRIKSLTNGLNGKLFSSDEVENHILFDSNTIVDLSRIGSMETKSLIMGILIMRLQEHRMSQGGMNVPLRHVTVLEEAHNLLKRTSTEQATESANLIGKSVEMLTNAIAEMRTYGEGFIIADQSPGLLDIAVIRNTNTKIILRLPDVSDRELVGRSASLNDEQIVELTKLQTGVAAIYQNGWLYPVLCKIDKQDTSQVNYMSPSVNHIEHGELGRKKDIIKFLLKDHLGERIDYNVDDLKGKIIASSFATGIKAELLELINEGKVIRFTEAATLINRMVFQENSFRKAIAATDFAEWNQSMLLNMDESIRQLEPLFRNAVLQCLLSEQTKGDKEVESFYYNWVDYMKGGVNDRDPC
ncbi:ATP-binding protein [Paenibacillus sp. N3.4]|uniref:ATP-binding protein n=1 Tax=Paenibacillus sp. N3.4 TaxID=2603222 RepID=UPI0011C8FBAC|nr:ATP-binding protein [Paenibacillus sp. N3.4]TXK82564.1 ATP-binding protein [Paenibacillus sp. N3.4]